MQRNYVVLGCLSLVILAGCKKREEAAPVSSSVRSWHLEPELRVAVANGPADSVDVTDLETAPDTSVYALQPEQHQITVFDRYGKPRKVFGRDQLSKPRAIGWYNGQIWVWEPSLRKLTRFKRDGTLADSRTLFQNAAFPVTDNVRLDAVLNDSMLLVRVPHASDSTSDALLRVSSAGLVLDTIANTRERNRALTIRSGDKVLLQTTQPFAERTYAAWSVNDGMIVFGHADTAADKTPVLRVTKVNQVGDTLFSKSFPYAPKRFDAVLVAPAVNRLVQSSRLDWKGPRPPVEEQKRLFRNALYTPRYLSPVTDLIVATDGTILVRREDAVDDVMWMVLDPTNGELKAEQRGPAKSRGLLAGGSYLFAAEHTPGEIPEIVRYRVFADQPKPTN